MIKINLLGEESSIDESGKLMLLGYAASVFLLFLIFIVMQSSVISSLGEVNRDVEDLNQQLVQLKKTTQEVRDLEKKKMELAQITATIAKLKLSQEGPVKVLDDLNSAVSAKAWLKEVDEKSGVMSIGGMALNDHEIVTVMKNLETSDYFETVDLVESVSVSLVKITALNHFNNKYTRYIVRAEDKQPTMKMIQDYAKKNGLKFENTDGPPTTTSSGQVTVMGAGELDASKKLKNIRSGVFRASSGRVEKVSVWSSVQPVPAKVYTIRARVLYAGKLKQLMNLEAGASPDQEVKS